MRYNLRMAIETRFGTQLACARSTGIHSIKLNRLCRGRANPTPVERDRLSDALGADPQWLFSTVARIPAPAAGGEKSTSAPILAEA